MNSSRVNVRMCQVEIGHGDTDLIALLGSCVGIGLIWEQRGICGLAHCLLSSSNQSSHVIGAKHVDQALYSLEALMGISDYSDIRAVLVGGANMTIQGGQEPRDLIGDLNIESAVEELTKRNVVISQQDTGGNAGRKLKIDCLTCQVSVSKIPRIEAA